MYFKEHHECQIFRLIILMRVFSRSYTYCMFVDCRPQEVRVNTTIALDMKYFWFIQVRNEFYKDTQGVLLVFDVTSQQSFDSLQNWLNEMKKEIGDPSNMDKVVFVVCANKVIVIVLLKVSTKYKIFLICRTIHRESSFLTNTGRTCKSSLEQDNELAPSGYRCDKRQSKEPGNEVARARWLYNGFTK